MTETVTEVCDRWLALAAKRTMFSADELTDMLLDIRNAHGALAPLDEPVSRYRCSGCGKPEFEHPFDACAGAEWLPINNDTEVPA